MPYLQTLALLLTVLCLSRATASEVTKAPAELVEAARVQSGLQRNANWLVVGIPSALSPEMDALQRQAAVTKARGRAADVLLQGWLANAYPEESTLLGPALTWTLANAQLHLPIQDLDPRAEPPVILLALAVGEKTTAYLGQPTLLAWLQSQSPATNQAAAEAVLRLEPGNLRQRYSILHGSLRDVAIAPQFTHLQALLRLHQPMSEALAGYGHAYARALLNLRHAAEAEQVLTLLEAGQGWAGTDPIAAQQALWAGLGPPMKNEPDAASWLAQALSEQTAKPQRALLSARRALALGADRSTAEACLKAVCVELDLPYSTARYTSPATMP